MNLLVLVTAAAVAAPGPALRVVDGDPLVVAGRGFPARAAVTVTAAVPLRPVAVRVRASARGTFVVRLRVARSCGSAVVVTARAARALARAHVQRGPCIPPPRG